jgi:hypothetical protein
MDLFYKPATTRGHVISLLLFIIIRTIVVCFFHLLLFFSFFQLFFKFYHLILNLFFIKLLHSHDMKCGFDELTRLI